MLTRKLGRSGVEVSAVGMGCWAIGGPFWRDDRPVGWGKVNDAESIGAVHRALELGVTLFDTADVYGCGHSERVLGQALAGRREGAIIATKFGNLFDERTRRVTAQRSDPRHIRAACEASLRRLDTDYIDLYQFHNGDHDPAAADDVRETLEQLAAEGKIRHYGWSTDSPDAARTFAAGPHCTAVQQRLNIFEGNAETLAVCEELDLASLNRGPLIRGLLTGKFHADSTLPADDLRHKWDFRAGQPARHLAMLEKIREVLTRDGRSLAQAAIGWLWARSEKTIPIPGFKSVRQVEDNAAAMDFDRLSAEQMAEIDTILER